MGRPPSSGGPAFRFTHAEVADMEERLHHLNNAIPHRSVIQGLAEKFTASPARAGKNPVQPKQVWNWFQNRRYSQRSRTSRGGLLPQGKMLPTGADEHHPASFRAQPSASAHSGSHSGKNSSDGGQVEFEAKSARDGAWKYEFVFLDLGLRRMNGLMFVNVCDSVLFHVKPQNVLLCFLGTSFFVFRKAKSRPSILMLVFLMLKDTAVPPLGDTAAPSESQAPAPPAPVSQRQVPIGVTARTSPEDTVELVSVTQVLEDGTTTSSLMTPAAAAAYQNKVMPTQFAALRRENHQLRDEVASLHSKVDHLQSQLSEVLQLLRSKTA